MNILFLLFKLIGILFLLIILLTAVLLFHPIFYRIEGEAEEEVSIKGYFWWLFQILRLEFEYTDGQMQTKFRICGFFKKKEEEDAEEEEEAFFTETKMKEETPPAETASGEDKISGGSIWTEDQDASREKAPEKKKRTKKSRRQAEKWTSAKKKFVRLKEELTDRRNRDAAAHIWHEFLYLLSHLKPRDIKAELSFSTGDPAFTGGITGMLALVPFFCQRDVHIYPDFESEALYVKGNFKLKGHMAFFHFFRSFLCILLDKNIKRIYAKVRN